MALSKVAFPNTDRAGFTEVVKQRVAAYFQDSGISRHANFKMVAKTCFYIGGFVGLYALLLSGVLTLPAQLGVMMLLGFFLAGIGFNIGHDAIHGAYSSNPTINKLMGGGFECIGACTYTWRIRHNLIHHTYTNIVGSDGDLESMPLLRFCVKPGRKWFHRYQHLYAPLLYCFASLVWIVKKDFVHILEERRDQRLGRKPPAITYVSLVFFKALHLTLFLLLPYLALGEPFWVILLGFVLMHFVAGFTLAIVFQLGHLVDGPETVPLPTPDAITEPYAEHQLRTSANFGTGFWPTFFCGGLNYQIEHHLFPRICHVHYPAISRIVQQTATEFNLPYHALPNFFAGVRSHFAMLKYIGRADPTQSIPKAVHA